MAFKLSPSLKNTQIEVALGLLQKFVKEKEFWDYLRIYCAHTDLSEHDILENDDDILNHLKFMFACDLNIEIIGYKTRNPFSSVIGDAMGNRIRENTRKINSLTLHARVGHLGHEVTHLFGYHHEFQGQKTSVAVVFGKAMEAYAEMRLKAVAAVNEP